jgi:hypothetical protein
MNTNKKPSKFLAILDDQVYEDKLKEARDKREDRNIIVSAYTTATVRHTRRLAARHIVG